MRKNDFNELLKSIDQMKKIHAGKMKPGRKVKLSKHLLEDYADVQIAKDRLDDPKSRFISGTELRKALKRGAL